jgi:ADP-ribose pyrophosphatase YjhB (NUDIX family)
VSGSDAAASTLAWSGRIRPIAICVFRRADGSLLLAPGYDSVKEQRFYRPLGGEIEFGELAIDAVRREIREELGAEIEAVELLGVFENIFVFLGQPGHEIVWVYEAQLLDPSLYEDDIVYADEGGSRFEVHWVPVDVLLSGEIPLYPDGLLELLRTAPGQAHG